MPCLLRRVIPCIASPNSAPANWLQPSWSFGSLAKDGSHVDIDLKTGILSVGQDVLTTVLVGEKQGRKQVEIGYDLFKVVFWVVT